MPSGSLHIMGTMLYLVFFFSTAMADRAIPFGVQLPVATLIPMPKQDQSESLPAHISNTSSALLPSIHAGPSDSRRSIPLPSPDDSRSTLYRRYENDPNFRGFMQMDCLEAPEACQNACYYQNCVRGAAGSNTVVRYYDGGGIKAQATINRVNSGVTVNRGTPCKTWPFGQKFWDTFTFNPEGEKSEQYLETDEWPMASMRNDPFNPDGQQPQHTMRCITGKGNGAGGQMLVNFRQGRAKYKNEWKQYRRGSEQVFNGPNNWFFVNFNMEGFKDTNAVHRQIRQSLTYCFAPFNNCKNDGRQFHMTKLVQAGDALNSRGTLEWPYDAHRNNAYRMDGETADIEQFHVTIKVTGDAGDQVDAKAFVHRNGKLVELASIKSTTSFKTGDSLELRGDMPRTLTITKQGIGCASFKFKYGNEMLDKNRFFAFSSEDNGAGEWAYVDKAPTGYRADYCQRKNIREVDGSRSIIGHRLKCSFPAW